MKRYLTWIAAAFTFFLLAAAAAELIADRKIGKLAEENERLRQIAQTKQAEADAARQKAERHAELNEYLNRQIAEIRNTAEKQDELIKELDKSIGAARGANDRSKRIGAIAANADQLCRRLATLGYECSAAENQR
jgi:septal ring factor EnvC (AmiA/AmiB activator)